jgi:8-oxo-dGTP pyrophosphatase MutT (NUDIX family)
MTAASFEFSVIHVDRVELTPSPKPWRFADDHRAEIDVFFAALKRDKPAVWNGRVLMLHDGFIISGGVFSGSSLETDFASFAAWRAWGSPEAGVKACFGAAAMFTRDRAVLLGIMNAHTSNAGRIYFPSGTPEPGDIRDGNVDIEFNMRRELEEETGVTVADFRAEPGWFTAMQGPLVAHIKVLRSNLDAEPLRHRILNHLSRERTPELADIHIVRSSADFSPMMPDLIINFITHLWGLFK